MLKLKMAVMGLSLTAALTMTALGLLKLVELELRKNGKDLVV